jgi:hypothetical protein
MSSYNSPFTGNVIQPTDVSYRRITLTADLQLEWPINGTTDDAAAARIMEVSTASTANELWMPPANQASVGQDALIRNVGAVAVTVKDYSGANTIVTVAAGEAQYIYIVTNATTAGTWGIIAFGIGSSGADAATLAGYGLVALGQTLNQSHPVTTFASDRAATSADRAETLVWTGGAGTLTLDAASTLGENWFVLVRNSGTGALAVNTNGSDLLNGSTTVTFQGGDSAIIVCSGTAFYTVGLGKNSQFNFTQLTKAVTSGTYTLTSAEATNVIQKFTGTLTGNVTIIVPQTIQVYYVQNATVGTVANYTVTISTGVSGASVAQIAANQQATLVCDSVNIVNANTVLAGSSSIGLIDGSLAQPALYWGSEPTTGLYRPGSNQWNVAIAGILRLALIGGATPGLTYVGTGTFTGGVSGGTYL